MPTRTPPVRISVLRNLETLAALSREEVGEAGAWWQKTVPSTEASLDHERETDDTAQRVEVPYTALAPEVLRRLIEEFVTRDGTDYGTVERTLAEKVAAVMRQLETGDVAIEVDMEHETIDLVVRPAGTSSPRDP
jgi:uncharacterized protein YheU (UPF0270 family)